MAIEVTITRLHWVNVVSPPLRVNPASILVREYPRPPLSKSTTEAQNKLQKTTIIMQIN